MLENQNYKKNHKGTMLSSFEYGFKQLNPKGRNILKFKRLFSETIRNFLKERFLNIFDFAGISKK